MITSPSRSEKRESEFYFLAEQGMMTCKNFALYKSEEKNLRKKGFHVERHGEDLKRKLPSTISWADAYGSTYPLLVLYYCTGKIDTFPWKAICNRAQEFFVVAARANFDKKKTDNSELFQMAQTTETE